MRGLVDLDRCCGKGGGEGGLGCASERRRDGGWEERRVDGQMRRRERGSVRWRYR